MTRPLRPALFVSFAVCVLAHGAPTLAADGSLPPVSPAPAAVAEAPPPPEGRELAGHVFSPALGVPGPFATTNFGSFLTLGAGSTEGHLTLQLPGNPPPPPQTINGKVSYAAVGGVLDFEAQILRGVSARVGISETLYTGTTGAAAAVVGSNARLGGNLGLTAGAPIGNSVRVAGLIDASWTPQLGLLLGPAIKSAFDSCSTGIRDCRLDFSKLFSSKNVFQLKPGAAASWAPLPALGVSANLTYVYADASGKSQSAIFMGTAVDFDFKAISRVPLGLQASIASLIPFGGHDNTFGYTDLGGGVFYTGRKHLSLGLQFVVRRFRLSPDTDVSWGTFVAFIGLRYYW